MNNIAIVTLEGRATFGVLRSADPSDVAEEWMTEPGQVVLLAGWRPGSIVDQRPYHRVDPPAEGRRLVVQLRENMVTNGGAAGLTDIEVAQARSLAELPTATRVR